MHSQSFGTGSLPRKITGPNASAIKYDLLTALLVTAAQEGSVTARLALRLSLIITARFNWRLGTFAVGQRELARMWGVTDRTAKRDMAEMRARAWIEVATPAARGRVAEYRINLTVVLNATRPHWDAVGPDFVARLSETDSVSAENAPNVVPLRRDGAPLPDDDGTGWLQASITLQAQDPAVYAAWFATLQAVEIEGGTLVMLAPTRFQADYVRTHFLNRLQAVLSAENRAIRTVKVIAPADERDFRP